VGLAGTARRNELKRNVRISFRDMSRIHLGLLDELLNISILNEESSARSSELKFRVALELSASGSESVKRNLVLDLD